MVTQKFRVVCAAAGVAAALAGCQTLGPAAIDHGRDQYNSSIEATSMRQTLANLVRVYHHQPTLFMDVTEIDAVQSYGGSLGVGTTNIGARRGTSGGTLAGQVGSAQAAAQYSESPTVRYQPLLGQALVAQMVTPVSADVQGLLYDSSWSLAPILDLSSAFITPDFDEFYPALNGITELAGDGAIEVVAGRSLLTSAPAGPAPNAASGGSSSSGGKVTAGNDTLMIYLLPYHPRRRSGDVSERRRELQVWIRLLRIYAGTQPSFTPTAPLCAQLKLSAREEDLKAWDIEGATGAEAANLDAVRQCLPDRIELRGVPLPRDVVDREGLASGAAVMRTISALGILKTAVERPHPKIEFVTPETYARIRDVSTHPWNNGADTLSFYTLLPSDEDSVDCAAERIAQGGCDDPPYDGADVAAHNKIGADVARWLRGSATGGASDYPDGAFSYERVGADSLSLPDAALESRLGSLRRYMLIIVSSEPPPEHAYAAYQAADHNWYYVAGDDVVSQKTFHLLSLFLTMMATPSTLPPLSPVINVGG
jgi:hypothetical protein